MTLTLLIAWSAVTAVLILVLIHRSMLLNREEDNLYLDAAEKSLAAEQRRVISRIEALTWPVRALFTLSGVLLLATLAVWLWHGLLDA